MHQYLPFELKNLKIVWDGGLVIRPGRLSQLLLSFLSKHGVNPRLLFIQSGNRDISNQCGFECARWVRPESTHLQSSRR